MADSEVQWKSHRLRLVDNGDGTYSFSTSDSGAGGSTAANQDEQTALLTTIDADTGTIAGDTTEIAAAVVIMDAVASASASAVPPAFVRDDVLTTITPADGDWAHGRVDANGAQWVQLAGALSSATDSVAVGGVAGQGGTPVQFIDVDETEDEVKGSAGTLFSIVATNVSAGTRYLKIYDGTAAGVTVGSTTPKWTIALPTLSGFVWESSFGMAMATGITIAATTGVAVADTGAPGANDVIVNVIYK